MTTRPDFRMLADGTDGELITWDAAGAIAAVSAGTSGQVLTSNGAGAAPTFQAAASGDLLAANNLSDVANAATSLSNLGGIGAATSDTLTNKSFNANGTGNSLTNVDVADLANGTDGELITWDAAGVAATVAVGTANQVLTSNGAGAAPTFQAAGGGGAFTLGTPQTTTSGTAKDFTGIPAGTTQIIVMFSDVSLSGTDNFLVQLGDSGGFEVSGYDSRSTRIAATSASGSSTAGFVVRIGIGSESLRGILILNLMDSTTDLWVAGGSLTRDTHSVISSGNKSLSAELTQIRITRDGSNTFDAGSVNIAFI